MNAPEPQPAGLSSRSGAPAADSGGLRDKVGGGLGWSFANNVAARIANVAIGVVLARLLVPQDYGIFAASSIVLTAALSMNELGVSLAVIRWPGSPARIAPTVTTLALAWSGILYAACFFTAPLVASSLGSPHATTLIRVMGLAILMDAVASVPAALLTRAFRQRQRMAIDLACILLNAVVSIGLAVIGFGPWALVWGFLTSSLLSGLLTFWWAPERYRPGFDRTVVGELLRFGLPLAGASALLFLTLNVDYAVVGHQLGAVQLGFYTLAFNLCSWPVNLVSVAIRRVSFAGFSRLTEGDEDSGGAFVTAFALVLALTVPMCALLGVYARAAIGVLYGDRWLPAADALMLMCVLGAVRVVLELGYDYLAAIGRTADNLLLQGLWFLVLIPVLTVGADVDGIRGVAAGHAVVAVVIILPVFLVLAHRNGIRLWAIARLSGRPLLAGLVVVGSGLLLSRYLPGGPVVALIVGGTVSGALALLVVLPMRRLVRPALAVIPSESAPVPAPTEVLG
ncbi:MAG: lipopolysaccharide biosynthesis protein [Lapillicoccus sp.]